MIEKKIENVCSSYVFTYVAKMEEKMYFSIIERGLSSSILLVYDFCLLPSSTPVNIWWVRIDVQRYFVAVIVFFFPK